MNLRMIDLENLESISTIFKIADEIDSAEDAEDLGLVKHNGEFKIAMSFERFKYLLDCENILENMGKVGESQ